VVLSRQALGIYDVMQDDQFEFLYTPPHVGFLGTTIELRIPPRKKTLAASSKMRRYIQQYRKPYAWDGVTAMSMPGKLLSKAAAWAGNGSDCGVVRGSQSGTGRHSWAFVGTAYVEVAFLELRYFVPGVGDLLIIIG